MNRLARLPLWGDVLPTLHLSALSVACRPGSLSSAGVASKKIRSIRTKSSHATKFSPLLSLCVTAETAVGRQMSGKIEMVTRFFGFVLLWLVVGAMPLSIASFAQDNNAFSRYQEQKRMSNDNVVSIIGSQAVTAYTRLAEDIQNVLDEKEAGGLRVLPIIGKGGGQNFLDLLFLRGIDMGIMEQDVIAYFKKKDPVLFANSEARVHYITKLSNSEYHIFAKKNIRTLADLRGKKVNFFKTFSSSAIATETIFGLCGIEVEQTNYDTDLSVQKLKEGEIAAVARISGAPHNAFDKLSEADGHFLPLDANSLPAGCYEKLLQIYLPAFLKHEHYPQIIPKDQMVPTVANSTVLAVYNWPENTDRYQRIARFVTKFFDNIDKLRDGPRHPKWKELNVAAEVPGWKRFKPAQDWIDQQRKREELAARRPATDERELKTAFDSFIQEYTRASGTQALSPAQREALFGQFVKWWQTQKTQQANR